MLQNNQDHNDQQNDNKIISGFVFEKTIGHGTFSKVKIGTHITTHQKVAIKIIEKDKIVSQKDQARLNRQIKILRKVRHPHIAQLLEIIEDNKHIYLVSEYAPKGQLFDHIVSQQRLPEFQASKFLLQLLSAIQYIHSLGIAHRDLKPENLLLDQRYNLKLIDFGLSNIYSHNQLLKTACGSPNYAAPEMIKNQDYHGLKTDIWSCGVVLYAMAVGYLPFDDADTSALYKHITQANTEIPQHVSQDLKDLLGRILRPDPSERASIDQILSHNFIQKSPYYQSMRKQGQTSRQIGIIIGLSQIVVESQVKEQMIKCGQSVEGLEKALKNNKHNNMTASYYLLLQKILKSRNQTIVSYYVRKNHIINRYIFIERAKINYERRVKLQLLQLEISRVKREGQKDRRQIQSGQASHEKTLKKVQNIKVNEKHQIKLKNSRKQQFQTPQKKRRVQSAVKKNIIVSSLVQSPNTLTQKHNIYQSGKNSRQSRLAQKRAFSNGKKQRSQYKKLKKSKKLVGFQPISEQQKGAYIKQNRRSSLKSSHKKTKVKNKAKMNTMQELVY